jgi:hypothetical protein
MKRTEIDYVKIHNDNIQIIDYRNVASMPELKKEFGEEVVWEYQKKIAKYKRTRRGLIKIVCGSKVTTLKPNLVMHEKKFKEIITKMRLAGEMLKDAQTVKVKTIKI